MDLLTGLLREAARLQSRIRASILGVVCMALPPALGLAAEADSLENAVKATFLYKFALYVDWPQAAFGSPTSPINLCVAGDDPFGATLDTAVADQRIGGRELTVRRLKTVGRDSGCHILYVGGDTQRVSQIVAAVRGSSVLTVTDVREAGSMTGIINFVIKDNRVRFDIDDEAAARNGLAISSKLLGLALDIKRRQPKEGR